MTKAAAVGRTNTGKYFFNAFSMKHSPLCQTGQAAAGLSRPFYHSKIAFEKLLPITGFPIP